MRRLALAAIVALAAAAPAAAAPGELDSGWGSGGTAQTAVAGGGDSAAAAALVDATGRLVIAGRAQEAGETKLLLARFTESGALDPSFGDGGTTLVSAGDGGDAELLAVTTDGQGRIVAAGRAADGGENRVVLARFGPEGRIDSSFGSGGVALLSFGGAGDSRAQAVAMAGDQIVVAGAAGDDGVTKALLARLQPNGTIDGAFGSGGSVLLSAGTGAETVAAGLARRANGGLVIAGHALDPAPKALVARYSSGGYPEGPPTLTEMGDGSDTFATAVVLQGDKIVIGGNAVESGATKLMVARYEPDGVLDPSFHEDGAVLTRVGSGANAFGAALALGENGTVMLAGRAADEGADGAQNKMVVARYAGDGTLDAGFGAGGVATASFGEADAGAQALTVQTDGRILLAGAAGEAANRTLATARVLSNAAQTGGIPLPGGGAAVTEECADRITFAFLEAVGCFQRVNDHLFRFTAKSGGEIKLNGLRIKPGQASTSIEIDTRALSFKVVNDGRPADASVFVGDILVYDGTLNFDLAKRFATAASGAGSRYKLGDFSTPKGSSLFGFPIGGKVELTLVSGGVEAAVNVSLPSIFKSVLGGGLTGAVLLRASNEKGLNVDGLRIQAPEVLLGGVVRIKNFKVEYSDAAKFWSGEGTFYLPTPAPQYAIKAGLGIQDGAFKYGTAGVDGLNVAMGPGIFLQRVSFAIYTKPTRILGSMGLSAGPQVAGVEAVSIDGNLSLTFPGTPAAIIALDGKMKVAGYPLAEAYFSVDSDGYIAFGGRLDLDIEVVSIDAKVDGWIDGFEAFNLEGHVGACLVVACAGAEAVVSSQGLAICAYSTLIKRVSIGAGITWDPFDFDLMGPNCDIGEYRAQRPSALAGASAARALTMPRQQQGAQTVTLKPGMRVAAFRAVGDGAPPKVTLTGPNGETVSTPADPMGIVNDGTNLLIQNPADNTTSIAVGAPAGGTWTITPQPGSAPLVSVASADGVPPAKVAAAVRGRGHRRTLTYRLRPLRGQVVRFAEEDPNGRVQRVIGRAKGSKGRLRFAPADGPPGNRRIVALVEQFGMPRKVIRVARYRAPGPLLPSRPGRVMAKKAKGKLTVRWLPAQRAASYGVEVRAGDGRRLTFVTGAKQRRIVVPGFGKRDRAVVRVAGLRADNRPGEAARARVR